MQIGAIAMVLCILPTPGEPVRDQCDVIEKNTVYSYEGTQSLCQWVFWQRGHVRAWRLFKGERAYRDFERGGYVMRWHDGEIFREVRSLSYEESHLQYDPELEDRNFRPKERRKELLNVGN